MRRQLGVLLALVFCCGSVTAVAPDAAAGTAAIPALTAFGQMLVDDVASPGRVLLTDPMAGQVVVTDLDGAPVGDPLEVPGARAVAMNPAGTTAFVTGDGEIAVIDP